jgi:hypothetical protein
MKQLKIIGLMLLFLVVTYCTIQALMMWAELEASRVMSDYQIVLRWR